MEELPTIRPQYKLGRIMLLGAEIKKFNQKDFGSS
jgi:hypothetical protein